MVVAITMLLVYKFRWTPDDDNKQSPLATSQNNYGTNYQVHSIQFTEIRLLTDKQALRCTLRNLNQKVVSVRRIN